MEILNCGHAPTPRGLAAGVAHLFGYTMCLSCADADETASLQWEVALFAYLSRDNRQVITWPGAALGRVTETWLSRGEHRRRYVRMTDVHGQRWHGSGPEESGTYVRLHRVKPLDGRYSVRLEFTGAYEPVKGLLPGQRWVARFCGEWIGAWSDKTEATRGALVWHSRRVAERFSA